MNKLMAWFTDADWKTWLGHFLLGAIMVVVCYFAGLGRDDAIFAVALAFLYREISDLVSWWGKPKDIRRPIGEKVRDGLVDLIAPVLGAALMWWIIL
jgi:hypothetical protein